ncbi:TPA: hypothetical protein ACGUIF_004898 [Serratia liquefaciens]
MAKKTKYYALDALGNEHTRTTARVYTHMVVLMVSQKNRRAFITGDDNRKVQARNHAFYCREATEQPNPNYGEPKGYRDFCKEAAGMTCGEYVEKKIAEQLAVLNANGAGDYEDFYRDCGWCSRLDLAQKLAAKWAGNGKVEILEAQTK